MSNDKKLKELETLESAARLNGLTLAKIRAAGNLEGYPTHKKKLNKLIETTEKLLQQMKYIRLFCTINEN